MCHTCRLFGLFLPSITINLIYLLSLFLLFEKEKEKGRKRKMIIILTFKSTEVFHEHLALIFDPRIYTKTYNSMILPLYIRLLPVQLKIIFEQTAVVKFLIT